MLLPDETEIEKWSVLFPLNYEMQCFYIYTNTVNIKTLLKFGREQPQQPVKDSYMGRITSKRILKLDLFGKFL
jgi:hypothetical protein